MPSRKTRTLVQQYVFTGLLTIIPVWVTYLVMKFLLEILTRIGAPVIVRFSNIIQPYSPPLARWLVHPLFLTIASVILIITILCIIGFFTTRMIGKRLIAFFDSLIAKIPFIHTIYSSAKKLIEALQTKPGGAQRVVLIDFPSPEMKTVGFVTRTFKDKDTGRELAAVYVPTTPNPTSGYLEIVPIDKVTSTRWTVDEAMTFVVSGGAVSPDQLNYDKSAAADTEK